MTGCISKQSGLLYQKSFFVVFAKPTTVNVLFGPFPGGATQYPNQNKSHYEHEKKLIQLFNSEETPELYFRFSPHGQNFSFLLQFLLFQLKKYVYIIHFPNHIPPEAGHKFNLVSINNYVAHEIPFYSNE